jgi:hypothetical protein
VMAEVERRMLAEMDRFSPETLMKSWLSFTPQSAEQASELFMNLFNRSFGGGKPQTK